MNAQSGAKSAANGNSVVSTGFLGATNNALLLFKTNSVQHMSLSGNGIPQVNSPGGYGTGFATEVRNKSFVHGSD